MESSIKDLIRDIRVLPSPDQNKHTRQGFKLLVVKDKGSTQPEIKSSEKAQGRYTITISASSRGVGWRLQDGCAGRAQDDAQPIQTNADSRKIPLPPTIREWLHPVPLLRFCIQVLLVGSISGGNRATSIGRPGTWAWRRPRSSRPAFLSHISAAGIYTGPTSVTTVPSRAIPTSFPSTARPAGASRA